MFTLIPNYYKSYFVYLTAFGILKLQKKSSTNHIHLRTLRKWVQATSLYTVLNVDHN